MRIDRYIINLFVGPTGTGLYHISKNLTDKLMLVSSSISLSMAAPVIEAEEKKAWSLVSKSTRINLQIMAVICIFLFIIAPYLIPFLYGKKFIPSVTPFRILLITQFFIALGGSTFPHYISGNLGRAHITAIITWVALLISIPLSIILTKTYGINGAALATTITYGIAFLLTVSYIKFFLNKPISQIFIPKKEDINTYINLFQRIIKNKVRND